ncbi:hypothetical protein [Flavobacterium sp.]|uniref:hypothetical protein n=1 Tax=Flavobacterium sp. TaxID=239 RepID=UPI0024873EEA|nr:hypothetical protein [Flavobacterium sp.]MDI1317230.1 hypothetical protein [Flavobacterium sp.]
MKKLSVTTENLFNKFLSETTKTKSEKVVVTIAIISFIVHLFLIFLVDFNWINPNDFSGLLKSPMVAIYTPFSFILLYEAYLLVYYLPKSTTKYIGKQYEIITLIIIRRIFKDLYKLEFTSDWFSKKDNILFTLDVLAVLILFYLIYVFYKILEVKQRPKISIEVEKFIELKKIIATILVPLFLLLAIYNFSHWIYENFYSLNQTAVSIKNTNKIFFEEFFTVLILIDVLLLLFSLFHTDKFNQVIRNSGFIISTILIKLSFNIDGVLNTIITVAAVLIGVLILYIHNKYEKLEASMN